MVDYELSKLTTLAGDEPAELTMAASNRETSAQAGSRFTERVIAQFQYLLQEFGFEVAEQEENMMFETVLFKNATTAVRVTWEMREGYIEVRLSRLDRGSLPSDEDVTQTKLLALLLKVRAPHVVIKNGRLYTQAQQDEVLAQQAQALREFGSDILGGDFSIFSALTRKGKPG